MGRIFSRPYLRVYISHHNTEYWTPTNMDSGQNGLKDHIYKFTESTQLAVL